MVCGRVFPDGQGLVIKYGGVTLEFHSNKCASKFFRSLLERVDPDVLTPYIKRVVEEYKELYEAKAKKSIKSI
ncbi:hypothetical protein ACSU1N_03035 [Thermogladius sp. 4427co]|uniref:hypothetical protein n=1 Tax=Thermogladius sp. 4427co TaxID=3450718 RepID=UPI003F7A4159